MHLHKRKLKDLIENKAEVFSVSLEKKSDFSASFNKTDDSLEVSLKSPYGKTEFNLRTISRYIASNVICSIAALSVEGVKIDKLAECASEISFPAGRLESIRAGKDICYVDYAHTPEALKYALKEIREFYEGEIWCVFGCGGDRDKGKRPIMGKIAEDYSDHVIITDDNPRNEDPKEIRKSISKKINKSKLYDIANRAKAIDQAIQDLSTGEILVVAGKGHEKIQDYGKFKKFFSDKDWIIKSIKKKNKFLKNDFKFNILKEVSKNKNLSIKTKIRKASINSREIKKNDIFFALKGRRKDGNSFIKEAFKNGASLVIVETSTLLFIGFILNF